MVYGFVRNWFRVLVFRGCSKIGFGFMGFYELGNNSHPLSLCKELGGTEVFSIISTLSLLGSDV